MSEETPSADGSTLPVLGPLVEPPPRRVGRKLLYGGVGCLALVVLVVGGTVAWNMRALSRQLDLSAAELAELAAVRQKLVAGYRTADVAVRWRINARYSLRQGGRVAERRLIVRMTNPPFLMGGTPLEKADATAREIAFIARGALKNPSAASTVDVVLTKKAGFGVTVAAHRTFSFTADEITGGR